jgi:hypothetical protein
MRAIGALLAAMASARSMLSQRPAADSAVVPIVLAAVLGQMGPELAASVTSSTLAPWQFDFPHSRAWTSVSAGLARILNARAATLADRDQYYLHIEEHVVSDTARVFSVAVGRKWRCASPRTQRVASERSFEVRLVLRNRVWEQIPSGLVTIGDRGLCEGGIEHEPAA